MSRDLTITITDDHDAAVASYNARTPDNQITVERLCLDRVNQFTDGEQQEIIRLFGIQEIKAAQLDPAAYKAAQSLKAEYRAQIDALTLAKAEAAVEAAGVDPKDPTLVQQAMDYARKAWNYVFGA